MKTLEKKKVDYCPTCGAMIETTITNEIGSAKAYWSVPTRCVRPPCAFVKKIESKYVLADGVK